VRRHKIVSRLAIAAGALGLASLTPLPLTTGPLASSCAEAATGPSVAIVVDFGNVAGQGAPPGGVVTRCVPHYNDLSGAQALIDAGFVLRLEGGLLCAINNYPADGCGEKTGARKYLYWSYWKARPGESGWGYSGSGVDVEIRAGVSEGWRFVEGSGSPNDPQPGAAPDHLTICGPLQPDTPSNPAPHEPNGSAPALPSDGGAAPGSDGGSATPSDDPTGAISADAPADVAATREGTATTDASTPENAELALEDATPAAETTSSGGVIGLVAVVVLIAALGGAAVVRSKRHPRTQ
jgi:hypothetical protein